MAAGSPDVESAPGEKPISESDRYVRSTIRSTGWVAGFVVFVLAGYGQWWAIAPFVAGVGLAVVLLDGWRRFVVGALTPSTARAPGQKSSQSVLRLQWRFLFLALVKYPLVAVFLWALVRPEDF